MHVRFRFGLAVVSSVLAVQLVACGGAKQKGAEAPESDPWSDYKGTFAGPLNGPSRTASDKSSKPAAKAKDAEGTKAEAAPAEPEPMVADASKPASGKKPSPAKKSAGKPKTASK